MKNTLCTWEDDLNHRHVQFSVDYSIENGAIAVRNVTPVKVIFVCPESNTVQRTTGVHTNSGRQLLARQFQDSSAWQKLPSAIAYPNADTVIPNMSIRMEICAG